MRLWDIATAIGEGVISIPVDLYYGGRRTMEDVGVFGSDVAQQNAAERERIVNIVKKALENRALLTRVVRIVVQDFAEKIPPDVLDKIHESLQSSGITYTSRKVTQFALANFLGTKLTEKIVTRAIARRLAKFGVGLAISAVLLQGMLERASNATQRLEAANPQLHQKLKSAGLDMLYFLVEEEVAPLVSLQAIQIREPETYRMIESHLLELVK